LGIRLFLNFSQALIPGVNGGYYPIQVRALLENGRLAFSDMPLAFYLNAAIVKTLTLFGIPLTDQLIINTLKLTDSFSVPLIVLPFYWLLRESSYKISNLSVLAFATLSFAPLMLTSDLQKNSLAVLFSFYFIGQVLLYLKKRSNSALVLAVLFFFLALLTHFGTFVFLLVFTIGTAIFHWGKRAILPLLLIIVISLFLIAVIDYQRFDRLLHSGLVMFEHPALLTGQIAPPEILAILLAWFCAYLSYRILLKKDTLIPNMGKALLKSSCLLLVLMSFPLLDTEYLRRFSLLSFIPETFILFFYFQLEEPKNSKTIFSTITFYTGLSIMMLAGNPKPPAITQAAYNELSQIDQYLPQDRGRCIIIVRHGLEWWTAWKLKVKIAQDKAIDEELFTRYDCIYKLKQQSGFGEDQRKTPFHEPETYSSDKLIYASAYFELFEVGR
jgi:hypothetical protein